MDLRAATAERTTEAGQPQQDRTLPSGRSVVVRVGKSGEELEVRAADGRCEVRIHLTDDGPVIYLEKASLRVESVDDVAIRCRSFEVQASEDLRLHGAGDVSVQGREFRLKTESDIHMNGDVIRLNCDEEVASDPPAASSCGSGCGCGVPEQG